MNKMGIEYSDNIDGYIGVGMPTILISHLNGRALADILEESPWIERVLFCKEFTDWEVVRSAFPLFDHVCIEAVLGRSYPADIVEKAEFHWSINVPLAKPGDYIRVGNEAFIVGEGNQIEELLPPPTA